MGKHAPSLLSAVSWDTPPACSVSAFSLPGEATSEPRLLQPNYQCALDCLSQGGGEHAQCGKNTRSDQSSLSVSLSSGSSDFTF